MNSKFEWSDYPAAKPVQESFNWSDYPEAKPAEGEKTSSIGAFLRSAGRMPHDLFTGLGVPESAMSPLPEFLKEKKGDIQHPLAETAGSVAIPGVAAFKGLGLGGKLLSGLLRANNIKNIGSIGKQEQQAGQQAEEVGQLHGNLLSRMKEQFGTAEPTTLQRQANEAPNKMQQTSHLAQEEPLQNIVPRLANETQRNLLPEAEQTTQLAKAQRQRYEEEIRKSLGAGESHDVALSDELIPALKANRQEIGRGYEQLDNELVQHNIKIPNTGNAMEINRELMALVKSEGEGVVGGRIKLTSPKAKELLKELSEIGKSKDIPADAYSRSIRSIKQLANETMQQARKVGGYNPEQRVELEGRAEELNDRAASMEKHLEEHVGDEFAPKLKHLNSRWRNEVRSLDKNKLHREIQKQEGIGGKDLALKLRGNSPGQIHLRKMVNASPTALRNVIGRSYADNPQGLLELPAEVEQYVQKMPKLVGLRSGLRQALQAEQESLQAEESARAQVKSAEADKKQLDKMYKQDLAAEAERQTLRNQNMKTHEENARIQKENMKIQRDIYKKQAAIKQIKESMENAKLSKDEHLRLKLKLSQAEKDLSVLKKILKGLGYTILGLNGLGVVTGLTKKILG